MSEEQSERLIRELAADLEPVPRYPRLRNLLAGNVASWQLRGPDGELIGLGGQQTALGVAERMLETTPTQPTKGGRKGKRLRG